VQNEAKINIKKSREELEHYIIRLERQLEDLKAGKQKTEIGLEKNYELELRLEIKEAQISRLMN